MSFSDSHIRGAIKYIERYKQLISYEGLERHRHITPTDIDGIIDYAGNAFFVMECKHEDKYYNEGLDLGQKKAIENMINAWREIGKISMAIVFIHNNQPEEIIMAKDAIVVQYYWRGKWQIPKNNNMTVLDAIKWFENYCKEKNIYI